MRSSRFNAVDVCQDVSKRRSASAVRIIAALALAAGISACHVIEPWPFDSSSPVPGSESPIPARQWIGKYLSDVTAKLGPPTSVQPMLQTAGQMIVYSRPGAHYIFETAPNGKIVSAVQTD